MTIERVQILVDRLLAGVATDAEKEELAAWAESALDTSVITELAGGYDRLNPDLDMPVDMQQRILSEVFNKVPQIPAVQEVGRKGYFRSRWWAAAAIFIVFGTGAYLWQLHSKEGRRQFTEAKAKVLNDALPGKSGAILTLSNGSKVVLDDLANGVVATQGNAELKLVDGQLLYAKKADALGTSDAGVAYNTVSTLKGRQYQITLPDSTRVWLNAASSLTYPIAFTGTVRRVNVTGEAYFEVAKNPKQPFIVKINNATEVEVLGTHFNVNAYADEGSINTTLLEGSIKITQQQQRQVLKPGQQAQVKEDGSAIQVNNHVDIEQVMAWKNGSFHFNGTPLSVVMRQIERWYDVEVIYEKDPPARRLGGEIKRDLNLSQLLEGLGEMGIKFEIKGKKLYVK